MANDFHKNLTGDNNHVIHAFTYADATARTGASGFVSADVGKVAKQTDNNTYWLLTATTPTWVEITSTGGGTNVEVQDEGSSLTTAVTKVNFVGSGVTVTEPVTDEVLVTIPGGGNAVEIEDEGSSLTTAVTKLNFVGAGVTASSSSGSEDVTVTVPGGSGNSDIVMSTSGTTKPYIAEGGTSYTVVAYVHYKGSIAEGTITAIKIIASMDGATDTGSIKIYDSTNSLTIAENVNGISGTTAAIYDLGTISNIPTGAAIFEIQVKASDSVNDFRLSAMRFKK